MAFSYKRYPLQYIIQGIKSIMNDLERFPYVFLVELANSVDRFSGCYNCHFDNVIPC